MGQLIYEANIMGGRGLAELFTNITNPTIDVYNIETGKLVGNAKFELPPESEAALLQLVNYGKQPKSLLLINEEFFNTPEDYVPPSGSVPEKPKGAFRGYFRQSDGSISHIEIWLTYDVLVRGTRLKDKYFFDSAQYNNIHIMSINELAN